MILWCVDVIFVLLIARLWVRSSLHDNLVWLAIPLVGAATIVLSGEALSLLGLLSDPWAWLVLHVLFLACSAIIWNRYGRPPLSLTLAGCRSVWGRLPTIPRGSVRALLVTVFACYVILGFICIYVPPNNWDSMTYHLSRVGFYLQQSSLDHFNTVNERQTDFPFNAELIILWTVVFKRSESLANLVQFTAVILSSITVGAIARECGARRRHAWFAALLFLSVPIVIFEATSTQNDLVTVWFFLSCLLFVVRYSHRAAVCDAGYAGIALGLGIGTKGTFLLAVPGLCCAAIWAITRHRSSLSRLLQSSVLASSAVIGLFLCGSLWMVQNWRATGLPLGRPGDVSRVDSPNFHTFAANVVRHTWYIVDWTGLPLEQVAEIQQRVASDVAGEKLNTWLSTPEASFLGISWDWPRTHAMHEDLAWFGPNGGLWLLPLFVVGTLVGIRFCRRNLLAVVLAASISAILFNLLLKWQPWGGRLFTLPISAAFPVAAFGMTWVEAVSRKSASRFAMRWSRVVVALAIVTTVYCTVKNQSKKLKHIVQRDREEIRFVANKEMSQVYTWLQQQRRPGATIGFFGNGDDWDYVCFIPDFAQTVIRRENTCQEVVSAAQVRAFDYGAVHLGIGGLPKNIEGYDIDSISREWAGLRRKRTGNRAAPAHTSKTRVPQSSKVDLTVGGLR